MAKHSQTKGFEGWAGQIPDDATYKTLQEYARYMRSNPTFAEKNLWDLIRLKRLEQYKFRRQHIIGRFIVDGSSHDDKVDYDARRTAFLENLGLQVLRFTNEIVVGHPVLAMQAIVKALRAE